MVRLTRIAQHRLNSMEQIRQEMKQMIRVSEDEPDDFLRQATTKTFRRQETVSRPGVVPNEIFFISKWLISVLITDNKGMEHTIHFAIENRFIADYASFMQEGH